MIEHVHDPEEFVGSLANLIVEGGSVIVTGLGCEGFDVQVLWDKSKAVHALHHLNFLSVEGFENVFRRAGFSLVEVITPGKLDFDIVKNRLAQNPDLNPGSGPLPGGGRETIRASGRRLSGVSPKIRSEFPYLGHCQEIGIRNGSKQSNKLWPLVYGGASPGDRGNDLDRRF